MNTYKLRMAFVLLLAWTLITMTTCFSPLDYKGSGEEGAITIDFGRGAASARAAAWPSGGIEEILPYIEHHITLKGPSGTHNHVVKGANSARFSVTPGVWQVSVESLCYDKLFATGTQVSVDVKAGRSNAVFINMEPNTDITFHTVIDGEWVSTVGSIDPGNHYIILTESITINAYSGTFTFGDLTGLNATIIGNGNSMILSGDGNLFNIGANEMLTIIDVKLIGHYGNGGTLIAVSGNFIMEGNSSISGNSISANGAGVFVRSSGTFTMNGGTIFDNHSTAAGNYGGGVYVFSGGTFIMNGGTVYGSNADPSLANTAPTGAALYNGGTATIGDETVTGAVENTIEVVNGNREQ